MASQQPPARPWFRFSSTNRPSAPAPAPAPAILTSQAQPPARQPRPPFVRPPVAQPPAPPVAASPPPQPPSPVAAPPPATTYVTSSSPTIRVSPSSSSLPASPAPKPSPKSTVPQVASFSSLSPSPKKQVLSASSSSLPTSPAPKVMSPPAPPSYISATAASTTTVNARAATPASSPKSLSAKMEPVSTPPSPLFLPPAQIKFVGKPETKVPVEAEKKPILIQKTFNTSNGNFQKHARTYSDSEDFGVRVITIAGENRGAIMELSPSLRNKGNPIALNSKGDKLERESNEEGRSKMKDETHKMVRPLKTTFINSNVQGASSSILLDCSFTQHGPGVHLSLSGKANGGRGAQLKD